MRDRLTAIDYYEPAETAAVKTMRTEMWIRDRCRMLPKDVSVEVFSHLPSDDKVAIVHGITDREITLSLIHIS